LLTEFEFNLLNNYKTNIQYPTRNIQLRSFLSIFLGSVDACNEYRNLYPSPLDIPCWILDIRSFL